MDPHVEDDDVAAAATPEPEFVGQAAYHFPTRFISFRPVRLRVVDEGLIPEGAKARAEYWLHRAETMALTSMGSLAQAQGYAEIAAVWQRRAELEFWEQCRFEDIAVVEPDGQTAP